MVGIENSVSIAAAISFTLPSDLRSAGTINSATLNLRGFSDEAVYKVRITIGITDSDTALASINLNTQTFGSGSKTVRSQTYSGAADHTLVNSSDTTINVDLTAALVAAQSAGLLDDDTIIVILQDESTESGAGPPFATCEFQGVGNATPATLDLDYTAPTADIDIDDVDIRFQATELEVQTVTVIAINSSEIAMQAASVGMVVDVPINNSKIAFEAESVEMVVVGDLGIDDIEFGIESEGMAFTQNSDMAIDSADVAFQATGMAVQLITDMPIESAEFQFEASELVVDTSISLVSGQVRLQIEEVVLEIFDPSTLREPELFASDLFPEKLSFPSPF